MELVPFSFSQHADYLGSVRAVMDFAGNILEASDFLPYGTRWSQTGGSAAGTPTDATNRWHYSGKEEQQALNSAIDEYKLFSRNCTTTVSDVLNSAGSSVLKGTVNQPTGSIGIYTYTSVPVTHAFVQPRSLQHHLKHNRNIPASYVKK
jgi:hypothetical protein